MAAIVMNNGCIGKQMSPNRGVSSGMVSFMLNSLTNLALLLSPALRGVCRAAGEKAGGSSKSSQGSRGEKKEGGQIALTTNNIKKVHANKTQSLCSVLKLQCEFTAQQQQVGKC